MIWLWSRPNREDPQFNDRFIISEKRLPHSLTRRVTTYEYDGRRYGVRINETKADFEGFRTVHEFVTEIREVLEADGWQSYTR